MFWHISFDWNTFYRRRFSFQLLTNAFVPYNIEAAVKLHASVTNEGIFCFSSLKNNVSILSFNLFLLLLPYEKKYNFSNID